MEKPNPMYTSGKGGWPFRGPFHSRSKRLTDKWRDSSKPQTFRKAGRCVHTSVQRQLCRVLFTRKPAKCSVCVSIEPLDSCSNNFPPRVSNQRTRWLLVSVTGDRWNTALLRGLLFRNWPSLCNILISIDGTSSTFRGEIWIFSSFDPTRLNMISHVVRIGTNLLEIGWFSTYATSYRADGGSILGKRKERVTGNRQHGDIMKNLISKFSTRKKSYLLSELRTQAARQKYLIPKRRHLPISIYRGKLRNERAAP